MEPSQQLFEFSWILIIMRIRMDGWVRVLRPFNSISVISRRWKGEHERLCAMKRRLGSGRISPPAGFEPATPWSEVGSANRSATRTLHADTDTGQTYVPMNTKLDYQCTSLFILYKESINEFTKHTTTVLWACNMRCFVITYLFVAWVQCLKVPPS